MQYRDDKCNTLKTTNPEEYIDLCSPKQLVKATVAIWFIILLLESPLV